MIVPTNVITWLQNYRGTFPFYISLKDQLERDRSLSQKQIQAVERAIQRDADRAAKAAAPRTYSYAPGDRIEIRSWIARKLAENLTLKVFFRNVEIVSIDAETEKAVHVSVKFVSCVANHCHVCGRELDTEISRLCGIGPVCADNLGIGRPTTENAQETLKEIERIAAEIGTVGPVWIPKSQIEGRIL